MTEVEAPSSSPGSPFWRFSLRFYRQPEVADACIALQEEAGVDVNLLMFLLWHATRARTVSAAEIADVERRIRAWREATVVPLRAVRRALKPPPGLVAPDTTELFRTRIKAVELEAERLQQEAMYDLVRGALLGRLTTPEAAARVNLEAYQAVAGTTFPASAVETLLAALTGLEH
jgi:uncharacterized protein (TIGR02444 family)